MIKFKIFFKLLLILLMSFGSIIARIEFWPLTDWRVFTRKTKLAGIFSHYLIVSSHNETKEINLGLDFTLNIQTQSKRGGKDKVFIQNVIKSHFKEKVQCPCEVRLIGRSIESIEPFKIKNVEIQKENYDSLL